MSNSPLVNYVRLSPMNSGARLHKIDTISIHCMAGNLSVEQCGEIFQTREASSNYGIGSDGRIALYVNECDRSWCTSSRSNDNRAVTIEVANIEACEPYHISERAWDSLIKLLVDICRRNGIPELRWKADPDLIGQVDKQNMTVHRWFAQKSCPGNWLFAQHGRIANEVNEILKGEEPMSKDEILAELGDKWIATYDDLPEWAKPDVRKMLDDGIINGGTSANVDPDDINMILSDIKNIIVCNRLINSK